MPVSLTSAQRKKLIDALTAALNSASIVHGSHIEVMWFVAAKRAIDESLPDQAKARRAAGIDWITNADTAWFMFDQLSELLDLPFESARGGSPLSSLPAFSNLGAVAERLVTLFETLPWQYRLLCETPFAFDTNSGAPDEVSLTQDLSLRSISNDAAGELTLHADDAIATYILFQRYPTNLRLDRYYLNASVVGYLGDAEHLPWVERFMDSFKATLGLAVVSGVLTWDKTGQPSTPYKQPIIAYRVIDGAHHLLPYRWLPTEDSIVVQQLTCPDATRNASDIKSSFAVIAMAFQDMPTRSAARWYLDSHAGLNGLVQIVQAAVSLEILLGETEEKEPLGLTSLLANRLGYMIGRSPTERRAVVREFKRLYAVRSQIVHTGKVILDERERDALYLLRDYARRAILTQMQELWSEWRAAAGKIPSAGLSG